MSEETNSNDKTATLEDIKKLEGKMVEFCTNRIPFLQPQVEYAELVARKYKAEYMALKYKRMHAQLLHETNPKPSHDEQGNENQQKA